jgi:hypothetical protein
VFYLDIAYVSGAIYICCCKRLFKMFHIFQTYVASVISECCICCSCYTRILQAYIAKCFTSRSGPHVSGKRSGRGWSPPACTSTSMRRTTTCVGVPSCRGGCADAELHAGQASFFFGKGGAGLAACDPRRILQSLI